MRYTQKHPQHTYTKRDVYYFSRVIPSDLRNHFTKPRIIQSLKTKSAHRASVASVASKMLSSKLDDYWLGLRLKQMDLPASHLLVSGASINLESNLLSIDEADTRSEIAALKRHCENKYECERTDLFDPLLLPPLYLVQHQ